MSLPFDPKDHDFQFTGTWKSGSQKGQEVTVEWQWPRTLVGDVGFCGLFMAAETHGSCVMWEGIPFICDYWEPLTIRAFAERLLNLTSHSGAWPELSGDRDRYLFPKVEHTPKKLRKRTTRYPPGEQIAGDNPLPR